MQEHLTRPRATVYADTPDGYRATDQAPHVAPVLRAAQKETGRGFTLLYALLVISVLLMVSSSIFSILVKEVRLSSFGRESQVAYYASETGAECALYWTRQGVQFNGSRDVQCAGTTFSATQTFEVPLPDNNGACAQVEVRQQPDLTIIESRGYNLCPGTGSSARRVERGLQVVF